MVFERADTKKRRVEEERSFGFYEEGERSGSFLRKCCIKDALVGKCSLLVLFFSFFKPIIRFIFIHVIYFTVQKVWGM